MTMRRLALVLIFSVASARLHADSKKLTEDQRIEILRGLSSEYAKIKGWGGVAAQAK